MSLADVHLDDKYDLGKSRIFITGAQAIVRLSLMQRARDAAAGLNTAGYITGYRGSPVGGLDLQFARAKAHLDRFNVLFQPGLNEDLAATALWGSQQAEMRGEGAYDGVFGMWYGKGPGVDRSGDVLRHANAAGTSRHGGVIALMGDDHGAESSTVAHQSEFAMIDALIPVLHPAGVQELIDYGLIGFALSRYSGCWVGMKCVHDNIESTAIVDGSLERVEIVMPDDFEMPPGGLNIRPRDDRFEQERRLHTYKRFAAVAFARANGLNRIVLSGGRKARIGIVSTGKSYLDVRQALDVLGVDEVAASRLGVRLLKVGMVWPLDPDIVETFAAGLDTIVVVEEKRSLLETQIREQLYNSPRRPVVIGKKDEGDKPLFPAHGTLEPNQIAVALGARIAEGHGDPGLGARIEAVRARLTNGANAPDLAERIPYFCSGCPHNSSTVLPQGGRGYAGIGCHWMVQFIPERATEGTTHMGGEGANWIGEAPFSTRRHVFQNLGDGTYNHSGVLAIRACRAAGVNITFKILYNDAVAMTGGQAHEGGLDVPQIARQVRAEGVERIAIVSDEPDKYAGARGFPEHVTFDHRDDLQKVQQELMQVDGVSVLIYDQTCAAEKRRRRKRGAYPDPKRWVFINEAVCEGCGDCGVKSNCVAIVPVDTPLGRKRQIDQSACNKDYSCLKGFCPSLVSVEGGELNMAVAQASEVASDIFPALPQPPANPLGKPWAMQITGIGGTGVVTIGQVLGMAAHLEGKGAGLIDMTGLAQKNGAVVTYMKIAARPEDIASIRVEAGGADAIIGCDLVTTASRRVLAGASRKRTAAVVNSHEVMPAQFARERDFDLPGEALRLRIEAGVRRGGAAFLDATRLARVLLGNTIAANMMTLGFAWQKGLVPLGREAIMRAIELNGVAVDMNQKAFEWGRRAAHDGKAVEAIVKRHARGADNQPAMSLEEKIEANHARLCDYQSPAYAQDYRNFVAGMMAAEARAVGKPGRFSEAVAGGLAKLMAYKDEYEVARLHASAAFRDHLARNFSGDYRVRYHLAPPLLARRDAVSGEARKIAVGAWMGTVFAMVARLKFLRGGPFDPFGYSAERRRERALIDQYRSLCQRLADGLSADNLALATHLAGLAEEIRGFGHVKAAAIDEVEGKWRQGVAAFEAGKTAMPVATAAE